ncbi:unnamed protein product [Paramecium sonneborni]|uniref:Uncharacterized protein n=1 Tax=Paramecium sonneborni TaxID=65129 RepID=A0A8S1RTZ3_9CILI|nr:unnamed protein product [Paramecium sonneborni]
MSILIIRYIIKSLRIEQKDGRRDEEQYFLFNQIILWRIKRNICFNQINQQKSWLMYNNFCSNKFFRIKQGKHQDTERIFINLQ